MREVFVHDLDTVYLIGENEHELVSQVRKNGIVYNLATPFHILNMEQPLHGIVRKSYFKIMTNAALEMYFAAIHVAVRKNMEATVQQDGPIKPQMLEGVTMAIAMLCGSYEREIAAQMVACMLQAF